MGTSHVYNSVVHVGGTQLISTNRHLQFEVGHLTITESARKLADKNKVRISDLLDRHKSGDWGDLIESHKTQNNLNLILGYSIISMYKVDGKSISILTSKSKSQTFVFTEEDLT
jgi:hypothetical protein